MLRTKPPKRAEGMRDRYERREGLGKKKATYDREQAKGIDFPTGTNPFPDHGRIARVFFKKPPLLRW